MKNNFIVKMIEKGIIEDLEKDVKRDIKRCKTLKKAWKSEKEKATSEELLQKSENIIKIMIKQKIKHISKNNKKAIENNDIDKISKIENNNSTIMLYLKLMEKEKTEDKQAKNTRYKQVWKKTKDLIENRIKQVYDLYDMKKYKFQKEKKKYIIKYWKTFKPTTIKGKGKRKQFFQVLVKWKKPIYNHITKQVKKGYNVNYKDDFFELQNQAIIHLLEYNKKYNKTIVMNSRYIFYKVMNKIEYIYQKNNIVNCLTCSLDRQLENSNTTYYNYIENSTSIDVIDDIENGLVLKHRDRLENMNKLEKNIYLLKLQGLTFKAIAMQLQENENTCKTIFYRLKEKKIA